MPDQYQEWRGFLIEFVQKIGKPDPVHYISSGNGKKKQGGSGIPSAQNIKINYANYTIDEYTRVYHINKPVSDHFIQMFIPFYIKRFETQTDTRNHHLGLRNTCTYPLYTTLASGWLRRCSENQNDELEVARRLPLHDRLSNLEIQCLPEMRLMCNGQQTRCTRLAPAGNCWG